MTCRNVIYYLNRQATHLLPGEVLIWSQEVRSDEALRWLNLSHEPIEAQVQDGEFPAIVPLLRLLRHLRIHAVRISFAWISSLSSQAHAPSLPLAIYRPEQGAKVLCCHSTVTSWRISRDSLWANARSQRRRSSRLECPCEDCASSTLLHSRHQANTALQCLAVYSVLSAELLESGAQYKQGLSPPPAWQKTLALTRTHRPTIPSPHQCRLGLGVCHPPGPH